MLYTVQSYLQNVSDVSSEGGGYFGFEFD
jgi:hypothetical protein